MLYLRSFIRFMLVSVALFGLSISSVNAAAVRDQGQIFGTGGLLNLGTDPWSQSITTGITGLLSGVEIQINSLIPAGNPSLTLSIYSGGNPVSGTPLVTEMLSLTNSDLDPTKLYRWDVSAAELIFSNGDVFSFGFLASATGFQIAGNDGPGYDRGNLFKNGSLSTSNPRDIGFRTYVDSDINAVPVPAAIWLFGTALIGLVGFSKRRRSEA